MLVTGLIGLLAVLAASAIALIHHGAKRRSTTSVTCFSFDGYNIPTNLINLTGAGPETFEAIAIAHVQHLKRLVGLSPEHFVLEIGCGIGRDAIELTKFLSANGRYIGVDIIKPSIDWCSSNISPRFPNFSFIHYDVKDQLHNPQGTTATQTIRLPIADRSVDRVILWSVFTHMFRDEILHYLSEFDRVLAPDGLIFATWFLVDEAIIASAQRTDLTSYGLRFEHLQETGRYINDPVHPLGAVAYTEPALQEMFAKAGFIQKAMERGNWSGHFPDITNAGQDMIILERAARTSASHSTSEQKS
jgi:SAM-dependent methyltransferase